MYLTILPQLVTMIDTIKPKDRNFSSPKSSEELGLIDCVKSCAYDVPTVCVFRVAAPALREGAFEAIADVVGITVLV